MHFNEYIKILWLWYISLPFEEVETWNCNAFLYSRIYTQYITIHLTQLSAPTRQKSVFDFQQFLFSHAMTKVSVGHVLSYLYLSHSEWHTVTSVSGGCCRCCSPGVLIHQSCCKLWCCYTGARLLCLPELGHFWTSSPSRTRLHTGHFRMRFPPRTQPHHVTTGQTVLCLLPEHRAGVVRSGKEIHTDPGDRIKIAKLFFSCS